MGAATLNTFEQRRQVEDNVLGNVSELALYDEAVIDQHIAPKVSAPDPR